MRKVLLTMSSTIPIFFSLGLMGIVKGSKEYFEAWRQLCCNHEIPDTFLWWYASITFIFSILSVILIARFLSKQSRLQKETTTIKAISYTNLNQIGTDQILSSLVPWLAIMTDNVGYNTIFFCIAIQCTLITIASYNNTNYNLIYSLLGYRHYEVQSEENTYILISKKCIRNKSEIKEFAELTDYMGIVISNKS